jgi:hypothetical protein
MPDITKALAKRKTAIKKNILIIFFTALTWSLFGQDTISTKMVN